MMLSQEEKFLIMLNHSSRELLQIMVAVKMGLDNIEQPDPEAVQLQNTLNSTWRTIERQIKDVSKYLKVDEDILQAYSFPKVSNEESAWTIGSLVNRRSSSDL